MLETKKYYERFSGEWLCQSEFNVIHNLMSSKIESSLTEFELCLCIYFNNLFKILPQFMVFMGEFWW